MSDRTKKISLDKKWYRRLFKVASFQDYEYLSVGRKDELEQRKNFFEGKIENPELSYPDLQRLNFPQKEKELVALEKDILKKEKNSVVKKAYRRKIAEKLLELKMLQAAKRRDDKNVFFYSDLIYGKPKVKTFSYTMSQVGKVIAREKKSRVAFRREAAGRLEKELGRALRKSRSVRNLRIKKIPADHSLGDGNKTYTASQIKKTFENFIRSKKIEGWSVRIDRSGKQRLFNVDQESNIINVPSNSRLNGTKLRAIIAHELGTHVLRRERGIRSRLALLGIGLDGYIKGAEGLATYREQLVLGTESFSGLDGHLAVSLAIGADGKPRSFREVFDLLNDWFVLISEEKSVRDIRKRARSLAWKRTLRTFRGTTGQTPGACFTRDIVYREGNIGIWDVVLNNPDEVKRFSVGKYDPSNSQHIQMLDELRIGGPQ